LTAFAKGMDVNLVVACPKSDVRLTVELQNVSLYDALRYCSEAADMRMLVNDNAVVLAP